MTAGCNDITSPLLIFDATGGCPSTCTAMHIKQLASVRCADVSADDPKLKALATKYIHWFNATESLARSGVRATSDYPSRLSVAVDVYENGCVALKNPAVKATPGAWIDDGPNCEFMTGELKSLSTLCPVTCRCAQKKGSIQCPTTCSSKPAQLG